MLLYQLAKPILFGMDAEHAHDLTLKALKSGLVPACPPINDPALEVILWKLKFPNPVGLAAGFDKNASVLSFVLRLGFGFAEAGTVTPKPQEGNPKPRVFRDPSNQAVINRMGFPSQGVNVFKENLEAFLRNKKRTAGVIGINIGMNKGQKDPAKDYASLIKMLAPMADYLAINISSPNTPGLRDLQKREPLMDILKTVKAERKRACGNHPPPILVKLAPDLDEKQCEELAQTVMDCEIEGIILTNTTLERPDYLPASFKSQPGGLSGKPLKDKSTQLIKKFHRLTKGKIPIVGVGGIANGQDAYEKIKAGASLVQLYTGLIYEGPNIANKINQELLDYLRKDGLKTITEAVGVEAA